MKDKLRKIISFALAVLIAVSLASCTKQNADESSNKESVSSSRQEYKEIGNGKLGFYLEVEFESGAKSYYKINTDKKYVGEALKELKIIDGENGPYGLYVLTVDGETHKYEDNKKFWEFYVDGKPSPMGVDKVNVQDGAVYSFSVES